MPITEADIKKIASLAHLEITDEELRTLAPQVASIVAYVEQLKPRRTFFTHIAHDIKHARDSAKLPAGVEFAYDGLVVESLPIANRQLPI